MRADPRLIRVLLAGMPPMLRDIVSETVAREPDMTVVGHADVREMLSGALPATDADIVIIGESTREGDVDPLPLLFARPQICVLVLSENGRRAVMHDLWPRRTALVDVSPQALVDAIRGGARAIAGRPPSASPGAFEP